MRWCSFSRKYRSGSAEGTKGRRISGLEGRGRIPDEKLSLFTGEGFTARLSVRALFAYLTILTSLGQREIRVWL
jgi:hypothetical protein